MRLNLPSPSNAEDFESLCLHLFREILSTTQLQKYGRSGHSQQGLDIIGIIETGAFVGIQCKVRTGGKLLVSDVAADITQSSNCSLGIARLVIATTARRDPDVQEGILHLASSVRKDLIVDVYFWDDIEDELNNRHAIRNIFYGNSLHGKAAESHPNGRSEFASLLKTQEAQFEQMLDGIIRSTSHKRSDLPIIEGARWTIRSALAKLRDIAADGSPEARKAMDSAADGDFGPLVCVLRETPSSFIDDGHMLVSDLARLFVALGDLQTAEINIRKAITDNDQDHNAWQLFAIILAEQGKWGEAIVAIDRCKDLRIRSNDRLQIPSALSNSSVIRRLACRYAEALDEMQSARIRYLELGDRYGVMRCDRGLGVISILLHDHEGAMRYLRSSVESAVLLDDDYEVSMSRMVLASALVQFQRGPTVEEEAEGLFKLCIASLASVGSPDDVALATGNYASMLIGQSRFLEADRYLRLAIANMKNVEDRRGMLVLYHSLARSNYFQLRFHEAEAALVAMIQSANALGDNSSLCSAMTLMSEVNLAQGKRQQALEAAQIACNIARDNAIPESIARSQLALGRAHLAAGNIVEADKYAVLAIQSFEELKLSWMLPVVNEIRSECKRIRANGAIGTPDSR